MQFFDNMAGPYMEAEGLPTKWNASDCHRRLVLSADGLELETHERPATGADSDVIGVRADLPMLPRNGIGYFEISIIKSRREPRDPHVFSRCTVGIGLSSNKVSLERFPGYEPQSFGYHGDDGTIHIGTTVGKTYGPRFGDGDIVGCGIDFCRSVLFFTINGIRKEDYKFDPEGTSKTKDLSLYPMVSVKDSRVTIRANFGATPFAYNIDDMLRSANASTWIKILSQDLPNPPPGEMDQLQKLVLEFLIHEGHADTARALAEDIAEEQKTMAADDDTTVSLGDEQDLVNRQQIRRAVMDGHIDHAIELTLTLYKTVFENNSRIYIRLRCRKFIELVREAIELRRAIAELDKTAKGSQEMDIDYESDKMMDDSDDTRRQDGAKQASLQQQLTALEIKTVNCGRLLKQEFSGDTRPDVQELLDKVFTLIAFGYSEGNSDGNSLLNVSDRANVAEELNAAILAEQGKPSLSSIEIMWSETAAMLEQLRVKSPASGAPFVSLQDIVRDLD